MRVLIVSNMYPRPHHPVGGIFVHEQVKALRAAGIDARVASGGPHWLPMRQPINATRELYRLVRYNREPQWTTHDGVPVVYFPYPAGAFCHVSLYPRLYAWSLGRWIGKIREVFPFDLIHAHTAFLDGSAAAALKRRFNVPVALTEHTGPFSLVTGKPLMRLATSHALNAADRILAVSRALEGEILKRVRLNRLERLSVLPNGVDTKFFTPGAAGEAAELSWALNALPPAAFDVWARKLLDHVAALIDSGVGEDLPGLMRAALDAIKPETFAEKTVSEDFLRARLAGMPEAEFSTWAKQTLSAIAAPALAGEACAVRTALATSLARPRGAAAPNVQSPGASTNPGLERRSVRVLWVGHLVEVKRVDRLIQAFAIAHRHDPRLRLTLIGSGHLEGKVRAWITQDRLSEVVNLLPTLSREGVREHMRHADFLVVSSETETFGVVAIEALSVGKPVLSTRCGGPEDVISDPTLGMLVDNNAESLAIGINAMARRLAEFDPEAIRRHAVERYDFAELARRLKGLYESLLHGVPSPVEPISISSEP